MSRWADQDSDAERLPDGMQRVGYDADTQRYTYVDSSGEYYEGPEGSRYGILRPIRDITDPQVWSRDRGAEESLLETAYEGKATGGAQSQYLSSQITDGDSLEDQNRRAWRYLLPFFLICGVVLLSLFYYINSDIAEKFGTTVDDLKLLNKDNSMECDRLQIGTLICVLKGSRGS